MTMPFVRRLLALLASATLISATLVSVTLISVLFLLPAAPARAQAGANGPVSLSIEVGYSGFFAPDRPFPIRARLANDGADLIGRLVVRPETSGDAFTSTVSTPVTLAAGARQTVALYPAARAFATGVRVELLDAGGLVVASAVAPLRAVQPTDRVVAVLSDALIGGFDLSALSLNNGITVQADLAIEALPDRADVLAPVSLIVFSALDTAPLSLAQRRALDAYVLGGGHLVVAGGADWAGTAAGLSGTDETSSLLAFTPTGAQTADSLRGLALWARTPESRTAALDLPSPIAIGQPAADAVVLAAAEDGRPLLVRRAYGAGTLDYLTADLAAEPLASWEDRDAFWLALLTTRPPAPSWSSGLRSTGRAAQAVAYLPGFDPLPDAALLFGFLGLYIVLIGPANYLILRQLNRREWAWITIPALIAAFTIAAVVIGGQLRGSTVTFNRLGIVRVYPGVAQAPAEAVIGLLSPRRRTYTLEAPPGVSLRPLAQSGEQVALFGQGTRPNIAIEQGETDAAIGFAVDSSFITPFHLVGTVAAPAVSGSAVFSPAEADGLPAGVVQVRGSVTNNTTATIRAPVLLARGVALALDPIAPGALVPFELTLPGTGAAAPPAPVPALPSPTFGMFGAGFGAGGFTGTASILDILGPDAYDANLFGLRLNPTVEETVLARRQELLAAYIDDAYGATGRGDAVYLAGWTDVPPFDFTLRDAEWDGQAETLLVVQLSTEAAPQRPPVTITSDRFTWAVRAFEGIGDAAPVDLVLQPGESAAFRFTPIPTARLAVVESVRVVFDDLSTSSRTVRFEAWHWAAGEWVSLTLAGGDGLLPDAARFIGPENSIEVRITADDVGGFLRIGQVRIEQTGAMTAD
jgi:hypothetical protein